jgi:hypothetical protein
MKLGEDAFFQDGKLIHKKTFDAQPQIDEAAALRSAGIDGFSDSKLVARLPNWVIVEWAKEAGISVDDPAMSEVLKRKLLSGEAAKFRVWEGTF